MPVFDAETESKDNADNSGKEASSSSDHKTEINPQPQTDGATQNGFASVYQAEEDDDVAEYDRSA